MENVSKTITTSDKTHKIRTWILLKMKSNHTTVVRIGALPHSTEIKELLVCMCYMVTIVGMIDEVRFRIWRGYETKKKLWLHMGPDIISTVSSTERQIVYRYHLKVKSGGLISTEIHLSNNMVEKLTSMKIFLYLGCF